MRRGSVTHRRARRQRVVTPAHGGSGGRHEGRLRLAQLEEAKIVGGGAQAGDPGPDGLRCVLERQLSGFMHQPPEGVGDVQARVQSIEKYLRQARLGTVQPDVGVGAGYGQVFQPRSGDELIAEVGVAGAADQVNDSRIHLPDYSGAATL